MLKDAVARDDFDVAASLSQTLLDNGCDSDEALEPGGIAAFAVNDLDKANNT